jgi:hypothetical protein
MGEVRYGKSSRYSFRPKTHLTLAGAYGASSEAISPAERERERRSAVNVLLGRLVAGQSLDLETSRRILRPEEGLELFSEAIGTLKLSSVASQELSKQQIAGMLADVRGEATRVIMDGPIGGNQATDVA